MDGSGMLFATLSAMAMQLPIIIVWLIGCGLCVARWKKHAQVSKVTLAALLLMLLNAGLNSMLSLWLPLTMRERGYSLAEIGYVSIARALVSDLISMVVWILVLIAIFNWRRDAKEETSAWRPQPN